MAKRYLSNWDRGVCVRGRLDANGFSCLIKERGIDTVVDASHPYAIEVSQNANGCLHENQYSLSTFRKRRDNNPAHPLIHRVVTQGGGC